MKTLKWSILSSILALAACGGSNNNVSSPADSSTVNDTLLTTDKSSGSTPQGEMCFLHTDGLGNVDSTKIHLIIKGDAVTGSMDWLPKAKDARKGVLEGTQNNGAIKAIWTFKQEGTEDTMAVHFEFTGDQLAQKPYKVNPATGRQQTDTAAAYSVLYNKVNCE